MKERRILAKGRTVLLVSVLGMAGSVGLLIPCAAAAGPTPRVFTSADTGHHGPYRTLGRGKSRHQKRTGASEARSRGKARSAAPAAGRPGKVACTAALDKAKENAQEFHLRAANEWFAVCARASCGRSMRQRCATVHSRIAAMIPSVVPVITDATGDASAGVQVRMDGEILTTTIDGTAIFVDPGDHQFTFAKDGEVFATRRLTIEKSQQHQIVSVSFPTRKQEEVDSAPTPVAEEREAAPTPRKVKNTIAVAEGEPADEEAAPRLVHRERPRHASAEADAHTGAPWSAYALAGVGLLGVGGYATFNLKGSADNDALVAFCKPNCDPTSVQHVRNLYLAADISLGIGIAALVGSTYLFLRSNGEEEDSPRTESGHISRLGVAPTSSGALATVGGTF